ncbi:MAG: hypothetical protein U1E05_05110 [Patescibacteria group bacterium]|nr:hypothetical protein [Patescibacteria group bacterium]
MSSIEREQLLGYALGALEDDEHRHVDARLRREPDLRRELKSVRESLEPLQSMRRVYEPPAGLAARTCRMAVPKNRRAAPLPHLSPCAVAPRWKQGFRFADLAVGVAVFLAAAAIIVPAVQSSRFNSHIITCQDKLRQIGIALTQYSDRNGGYFPVVPPQGALATAGIYAPVLLDHGLLTESHQVVCPSSPLAEKRDFQVPRLSEVRLVNDVRRHEMCEDMGGSYGYSLGHIHDGVYRGTRNRHRPHYAIVSDAPSLQWPELGSANHSGKGQNVLFEDGHVRFLNGPNAPNSSDHFFTNDDGQIAPGTHPDDSVIVSSTTCPMPGDDPSSR